MRAALGTSGKDCPGFAHISLTCFQQCPLHEQWAMPACSRAISSASVYPMTGHEPYAQRDLADLKTGVLACD